MEGEEAWLNAHRQPPPLPPSSSIPTPTLLTEELPVLLVPFRSALVCHSILDERLVAPAFRLMEYEGISSYAIWASRM